MLSTSSAPCGFFIRGWYDSRGLWECAAMTINEWAVLCLGVTNIEDEAVLAYMGRSWGRDGLWPFARLVRSAVVRHQPIVRRVPLPLTTEQ
jgi:hypothetical protein